MNTENLTPRKPKRYDENFKRSAVELWGGAKSVETIAEAVTFLASDAAHWVTGQNIRVNGSVAQMAISTIVCRINRR
jgi:NAD(P)-dependent dehydrogenase (short-subunit alcohol dehydrogenase family)